MIAVLLSASLAGCAEHPVLSAAAVGVGAAAVATAVAKHKYDKKDDHNEGKDWKHEHRDHGRYDHKDHHNNGHHDHGHHRG